MGDLGEASKLGLGLGALRGGWEDTVSQKGRESGLTPVTISAFTRQPVFLEGSARGMVLAARRPLLLDRQ